MDFKSGQKDYKSGQRDFKSGQERLQTKAGITNLCCTKKSRVN